MASTFQRDKVNLVFTAMDADGDGVLREDDFVALARRWASVRVAGDEDRLIAIMHGWWSTLAARSRDPRSVAVDDVLTVVDLLGQMPDAVTATADAMFEAVDEDGDGRISPVEYRLMIEAWNGRPTDTADAFARLDLDGDGIISRSEFARHWSEFWAGDDPAAPGAYVFGTPRAA
ncbi:EF-hand domain-containing protein [Nonomuraea soli]|uniref:Ca2+-binding EF-hand superfamily protein n=1 Tax=Nonomuraea soli TaxID=1032476 RepID=A0A7W0CKZ5_9ACTN|nr:EF-hand domain-containing protein [Nonomuraea soli]MBA2893112.1 Ca2+-binding EF-hand superfamily protein [Nonomuraea soli]